MKKLLFLLMFPVLCFGQEISLKELISIANMDSESFELYAMNKGYKLAEFISNEDTEGETMSYFKNGISRYVSRYSKYSGYNKASRYQFWEESELLDIYNELKSLNFTLKKREKEFHTANKT